MRPAAPNRATGKYSFRFGLMVIPVKMYAGCEDSGVKRSMRTQQGAPVGMVYVAKTPEGYDLSCRYEKSEIRYVVETDRGEVELTDDEVARAADAIMGDEKVMEVICTQPVSMIKDGVYIPENLHQLRADKTATKAFATILAALDDEGAFALVKFPTRSFVRYGALMSDGRLYTLRYEEEVRENSELPLETLGQQYETQARELIRASLDDEPRELVDEISAAVRAYAENKATGTLPEVAVTPPDAASTSAEAFLTALSATVDALRDQGKEKGRKSAPAARKTAKAKREKVKA